MSIGKFLLVASAIVFIIAAVLAGMKDLMLDGLALLALGLAIEGIV